MAIPSRQVVAGSIIGQQGRSNVTMKADGALRRTAAIVVTAAFLVLAPGTVVGLVPWWISRWQMRAALLGFAPFRMIGVLLIVAGLPVLLESFARFALRGVGTPAPVFPTSRLVVTGFYRFVRNPMYVAVVCLILGQALLLGNVRVLEYAGVAWLVAHLFVLAYEEPTLRRTYGAEYAAFCAQVPRWLPRLTPWRGSTD